MVFQHKGETGIWRSSVGVPLDVEFQLSDPWRGLFSCSSLCILFFSRAFEDPNCCRAPVNESAAA